MADAWHRHVCSEVLCKYRWLPVSCLNETEETERYIVIALNAKIGRSEYT